MRKRGGLVVFASFCLIATAVGCSNDSPPPDPAVNGISGALVSIQNDWEDGSLQNWIPRGPVTLTNTTEQAFAGTHSLKTTGRTAGFNGPSLDLLGVLTRGATY
jgi:endo-1,4-beta-xylanase